MPLMGNKKFLLAEWESKIPGQAKKHKITEAIRWTKARIGKWLYFRNMDYDGGIQVFNPIIVFFYGFLYK